MAEKLLMFVNTTKVFQELFLLWCIPARHILYLLFNIGVQYFGTIQEAHDIAQVTKAQTLMKFHGFVQLPEILGYFSHFAKKNLGYFFDLSPRKYLKNAILNQKLGYSLKFIVLIALTHCTLEH